jgi:hypothetical protein
MFLIQASQRVIMPHQARLFHNDGNKHDHDHDHDDGKESHSDFQPKQKKEPFVNYTQLQSEKMPFTEVIVMLMQPSKVIFSLVS